MSKRKFKTNLKTGAILSTILLAMAGAVYLKDERVRTAVDDKIESIRQKIRERREPKITAEIENISFNEDNQFLTFDKVYGTKTYKITVTNKRTNEVYTTTSNKEYAQIGFSFDTKPGDEITFEIIASNFADKEITILTKKDIVLQSHNPSQNKELFDKVYDVIQNYLVRTDLISLTGISVTDSELSIYFAREKEFYKGVRENLIYKIDLPEELTATTYNKELFEKILDYAIENKRSGDISYVYNRLEVFEGLNKNGAFENYVSKGYTISRLSLSSSSSHFVRSKIWRGLIFNYNGTFKATHPEKETIYFEQSGSYDVHPYKVFDEYRTALYDYKRMFTNGKAELRTESSKEFDPYLTSVADQIESSIKAENLIEKQQSQVKNSAKQASYYVSMPKNDTMKINGTKLATQNKENNFEF